MAEAEALRLQKENVTLQLIKLRQIEASIKAIEKLDGHMSKVICGFRLPAKPADL